MARTRTIDRGRILDAAEDVVCSEGVQSLTLDKVAANAGISKGGLTYSFPTKDALLLAMLKREVDCIQRIEAEYRLAHEGTPYPELHCFIEQSRRGRTSVRRRLAPITAALACSRESSELKRIMLSLPLARLPSDSPENRRARMVVMLLLGMHFVEGLGLAQFSDPARNALLDDVLRFLAQGTV